MLCLGRKPYVPDPRTLLYSKYAPTLVEVPAPPESYDGSQAVTVPWGMMLNDQLGDCTCAAGGHAITDWIAEATGVQCVPPDNAILKAYEDVSGYRPWLPWSDNGAVVLDVLKYWRKRGIAGHKIGAFVKVDQTHPREVMQAMYIFGGVYAGVDMPKTVALQFQASEVWHVPEGGPVGDGAPRSWGGHAIWLPGAWDVERVSAITWGKEIEMTWAFVTTYFEELWAIISPDFLNGQKETPQGFKLDELKADLQALAA